MPRPGKGHPKWGGGIKQGTLKRLDLVTAASDPKVRSVAEAARIAGMNHPYAAQLVKGPLREEIQKRRSENVSQQHELMSFFETVAKKAARKLAAIDVDKLEFVELGALLKLMQEGRRLEAEYRRVAEDQDLYGPEAKQAYFRAVSRGISIGSYLQRRSTRPRSALLLGPGNGNGA